MVALLLLAWLASAGAAVFVVLGPAVVMTRLRTWAVHAVATWVGALLLLGAWMTATYRSSVRAGVDESHLSVLSDWWWLAAAAGCAALAVVVARRRSA